ncbi:MAG: hypothetical protein LBU39_05275 [Desulfobulbaceae bacterium]|jgi:hypothetical protein|nr:hypothetical protein [Desulfobulbaceae bacterium]
MRVLIIDELSPMERDNIESWLKRNLAPGPLPGLFWLEIPAELLEKSQAEHPAHGPFRFSLELGRDNLRLELLIRNSAALHCSCTAYASVQQRQFALETLDRMLAEEMIKA